MVGAGEMHIPQRLRGAGRRAALALVAGACLAGVSARAHAETLRVAVVVGSNRGDPVHRPLRYAEQDAAKVSDVLAELGGLAASDVLLLRGPTLSEVRASLDEAARRVARWHADKRGPAVLLFYFSGHSDGLVLELGGEALPFAELRQRMTDSRAEVRLGIVDSCRSGALLSLKGGSLAPAFDIRLADDLASTGEAFIASSAADEAALESSEIGGSFFSHHFVSGLRGAADSSGDGLVTLAEAYQYAFARTLRATSDTLVGPQHPAYDYHLAGRGELVLTELRSPDAVVRLPKGFDRLMLVEGARQQVVAEIGPRSAHRIAVPAGEYELRGWRGAQAFGGRMKLAQGQELAVDGDTLRARPSRPTAAKGDADTDEPSIRTVVPPPEVERHRWTLAVSAGAASSIANGGTLGAARAAVDRSFGPGRLSLSVLGATGSAGGVRESRIGADLLPSWWRGQGRLFAGAGLGFGGGVAWERIDGGIHWSGLAWTAPTGMIEVRVDRRWAVQASVGVPITLVRRDDSLTVAGLLTGFLGVSAGL